MIEAYNTDVCTTVARASCPCLMGGTPMPQGFWKRRMRNRRGFTLIEVVITIVISALALAAIVPLLGPLFMRSHEPHAQLREAIDLHTAMENLSALQPTLTLPQFSNAIGAEGSLHDNRFTVVHNRYVTFQGNAEGGTPATNNLLKVTLRNALGEELSRLFAEAPP